MIPKKESRFEIVIPGLLLRERSTGIFYVRKTFRRHRIPDLFESLETDKKGLAKTKADDAIQKHLKKYMGEDPATAKRFEKQTLGMVIDKILETETPLLRKRTQVNHQYFLGLIREKFGHLPPSRVTADLFDEWIGELRRKGERTTFFDFSKTMNMVMRFAHRKKYTKHLEVFRNPDGKYQQKGRYFTNEELAALYGAMNEDMRDQFVLANDMMRLREVLYLTWDRVDLSTGIIVLRAEDVKTGSKTGKGRAFRVSQRSLERLIARRMRQGEASRFVFPSPTDPGRPQHQNATAWAAAKKKAGITGRARWHDIRHTALTNALLVAKCSPMDVAEYAGVAIQTIQRVYLHSTAEKTANVAGSAQIYDIEEV